ncbi:MAG: ATP-dependent DNA helicase RecQ [Proteobacteria bacterium]|nr:MAG: ATP-dependent DNA helicase RecQ [Pseudomonadota bacterium]
MSSSVSKAQELLKTYFGHENFRAGQAQVIEQILNGKSSAAVFPTGSGKSLCYQLPALLLPGLTLVVSPLLALMKDQIDSLLAKGIKAARLDSTLTNDEYQQTMRDVRNGVIKILYVAPERFMNERFRGAMAGINISLFAVDEAHCISEWGHNFRPDYLKLPIFAKTLGAKVVLALTATATPQVLLDIQKSFEVSAECAVVTGFYRSNLTLLSQPLEMKDKDRTLLADLKSNPQGPTIIYVTQQKTTETVARMLNAEGIEAKFYHAGMAPEERVATQNWFIASNTGVVVATIAFGMGIDKSNIRYVYHYNLPKSLENYSQEIGRAGRDGKPAICKV